MPSELNGEQSDGEMTKVIEEQTDKISDKEDANPAEQHIPAEHEPDRSVNAAILSQSMSLMSETIVSRLAGLPPALKRMMVGDFMPGVLRCGRSNREVSLETSSFLKDIALRRLCVGDPGLAGLPVDGEGVVDNMMCPARGVVFDLKLIYVLEEVFLLLGGLGPGLLLTNSCCVIGCPGEVDGVHDRARLEDGVRYR